METSKTTTRATRRAVGGVMAAVVLAAAVLFAGVAPASASTDSPHLDRLRRATAKYHNLHETLASGRVDLQLCVDQMGEHYANPDTFSDGVLDPYNPEALVYAHRPGGGLRLVAVEWVSTTPGEVMGIPLHLNVALDVYVLHAWIWQHNPAGVYSDMNPNVGNCP